MFETKTDRKTFFLAFIYGIWGVIGALLAILASAYLLFPPRVRKPAEWVPAASVEDLKLKQPEEVVFRRNRVDGWKMTSEKATTWLVKMSDSEVIAFAPQCTHLGCAYHWEDKRGDFVCPCHTSAFSMEGKVLDGPAPRPLDRYQVKVEGGKVLIGPVERSRG